LAFVVLVLAGFAAVLVARAVGERPDRPGDVPDHDWRLARESEVRRRRHGVDRAPLPHASDEDLGAPFRSGGDPAAWAAAKPAAGSATMSALRSTAVPAIVSTDVPTADVEPIAVAYTPGTEAEGTDEPSPADHASREMAKLA
jgi:hypothetical protein